MAFYPHFSFLTYIFAKNMFFSKINLCLLIKLSKLFFSTRYSLLTHRLSTEVIHRSYPHIHKPVLYLVGEFLFSTISIFEKNRYPQVFHRKKATLFFKRMAFCYHVVVFAASNLISVDFSLPSR